MRYSVGYPRHSNDEKGFLSYLDTERPFLYCDHTLTIFPATEEDADNSCDEAERIIFFEKEPPALPSSFTGSTLDGRKAVFLVTENGLLENGVLILEAVTAFFYHDHSIDENNAEQKAIQGFLISFPELNSFYPPNTAYSITWEESLDGLDYCVKTKPRSELSCGMFEYNKMKINLGIHHEITPVFNACHPLSIQTVLSAECACSIDELSIHELLLALNKSFQFLFMRKNIIFPNISLFTLDEKGKRVSIGYVSLFQPKMIEEKNSPTKMRCIDFGVIGENLSKIIKEYIDQKRVFEEYPDCYDMHRTYGTARNVGNFIAFDAYYQFYQHKLVRSKKYEEVKKEILTSVEQMKQGAKGDRKKYVEQIHKQLSNIGVGMKEHYKKVFDAHTSIFDDVIRNTYSNVDVGKEKVAISERLNCIRNALIHGHTSYIFQPHDLLDMKLLQIMIYVIRLDNIGISDMQKIRAVARLFNLPFHHSVSPKNLV